MCTPLIRPESFLPSARRGALACLLALGLLASSPAFAQGTAPREPAKHEPAPPAAAKPAPAEEKFVYVKMTTSAGDLVLELNETRAPVSVKNFLSYVDKGFYAGTIFHRVIADFMIQGGGMNKDGSQKKTDPAIKNEWRNGLSNVKYTIAMARLGGNPDSATSQFFINTDHNNGTVRYNLDKPQPDGAAYCVFGRVVDGMETVEKIRKMPVTRSVQGENSKPVDPVVIESVKRLTDHEVADWKAKSKLAPAPKTDAPKKEGT
ncbi:MAG: peptidylprolyl isomerase [Phycisphaerales bacterium]